MFTLKNISTHDSRSLESQLPAQLTDSIIESVFSKSRMLRCQSVANLVESKLLLHKQLIILAHSSSLEEVTDFVSRLNEIFITVLRRFWIRRREDLPVFLRRLRAQSLASCQHLVDLFRAVEILEDDVAISFELKCLRKLYHKSIERRFTSKKKRKNIINTYSRKIALPDLS